MIENFVDGVRDFYNRALNSVGEERDRNIYNLTLYINDIRNNELNFPPDSLRELSFRNLRELRGSKDVTYHLLKLIDDIEARRLYIQLSEVSITCNITKDFNSFYHWVNAYQIDYVLNVKSSVEDILSAVDEVRLTLLANNRYFTQLDLLLSTFVTNLFNLVKIDDVSGITNNRDCQLRLIAHLCVVNTECVPHLYSLGDESLKKVALHFYHVPIFYAQQEFYKTFLKLCENARVVEICFPFMALSSDSLPPLIEELSLSHCTCERISLSLPLLKKFTGPALPYLISLELQAPLLTHITLRNSSNLQSLRLDTPQLEGLAMNRTSLTTFTLDTPFLTDLWVDESINLTTVTLVHPDRLRSVSFEGCVSLQSFLEPGRGLPNCRRLNLYNCPAAVPQVPTTAEVFTGTRHNKGSFISFRVNPKDLAEKPLQVLLDFAKIFEKQNYFPNIVWVNPLTEVEAEGVDAGGLRRHFVASLTENLAFPLNEEGIPLLEDKLALETYGRLIGFAAESSLLFGSTLPLEFFYRILSDDDALKEVTNGVKVSLGPKWEKWKRNPQETDGGFTNRVSIFADQVQGKPVTVDNLFPLLQFDGENTPKTEEYFQRFFSEFPLLVDERVFQLKHFHQMMLGSLSLEGRPITIHVTGPGEALPPIHACSGEMEIPTYADYQTFKNKLMWALRALDTFETI